MTNRAHDAAGESNRSRRDVLMQCSAGLVAAGITWPMHSHASQAEAATKSRPWITIRGIYGGFPNQILDRGQTPADYGVNAVWVGSGGLNSNEIARYHKWGIKVFAEFNSMH